MQARPGALPSAASPRKGKGWGSQGLPTAFNLSAPASPVLRWQLLSLALLTTSILAVGALLSLRLRLGQAGDPGALDPGDHGRALEGSAGAGDAVGLGQWNSELCGLYTEKCPHSAGSRQAGSYEPRTLDHCQLSTVGGRAKDWYGAWPVCLDHVPAGAIVYSIGIGGDISFDTDMLGRGHRVWGFDPTRTPEDVSALFEPSTAHLAKGFSFMQVGLGTRNGVVQFLRAKDTRMKSMTSLGGNQTEMFSADGFLAPVLTLPTLMAALKHDHVDLLKIDVEGVEFDVCESAEFLNALDNVGHVLFEFHEHFLKNGAGRRLQCVDKLKGKGFRMVKSTGTGESVFARVRPGAKITRKTQR